MRNVNTGKGRKCGELSGRSVKFLVNSFGRGLLVLCKAWVVAVFHVSDQQVVAAATAVQVTERFVRVLQEVLTCCTHYWLACGDLVRCRDRNVFNGFCLRLTIEGHLSACGRLLLGLA